MDTHRPRMLCGGVGLGAKQWHLGTRGERQHASHRIFGRPSTTQRQPALVF